ncbi:MAG: DUF6364 family protein [Treponema sp.]
MCFLVYTIRVGGLLLTKLTLTIDKDIVESVKRYAKKENRSISKLVSDYLENISGAKKPFSPVIA